MGEDDAHGTDRLDRGRAAGDPARRVRLHPGTPRARRDHADVGAGAEPRARGRRRLRAGREPRAAHRMGTDPRRARPGGAPRRRAPPAGAGGPGDRRRLARDRGADRHGPAPAPGWGDRLLRQRRVDAPDPERQRPAPPDRASPVAALPRRRPGGRHRPAGAWCRHRLPGLHVRGSRGRPPPHPDRGAGQRRRAQGPRVHRRLRSGRRRDVRTRGPDHRLAFGRVRPRPGRRARGGRGAGLPRRRGPAGPQALPRPRLRAGGQPRGPAGPDPDPARPAPDRPGAVPCRGRRGPPGRHGRAPRRPSRRPAGPLVAVPQGRHRPAAPRPGLRRARRHRLPGDGRGEPARVGAGRGAGTPGRERRGPDAGRPGGGQGRSRRGRALRCAPARAAQQAAARQVALLLHQRGDAGAAPGSGRAASRALSAAAVTVVAGPCRGSPSAPDRCRSETRPRSRRSAPPPSRPAWPSVGWSTASRRSPRAGRRSAGGVVSRRRRCSTASRSASPASATPLPRAPRCSSRRTRRTCSVARRRRCASRRTAPRPARWAPWSRCCGATSGRRGGYPWKWQEFLVAAAEFVAIHLAEGWSSPLG